MKSDCVSREGDLVVVVEGMELTGTLAVPGICDDDVVEGRVTFAHSR